eukprot:8824296-Pyramimonas_sp.AAC.1
MCHRSRLCGGPACSTTLPRESRLTTPCLPGERGSAGVVAGPRLPVRALQAAACFATPGACVRVHRRVGDVPPEDLAERWTWT